MVHNLVEGVIRQPELTRFDLEVPEIKEYVACRAAWGTDHRVKGIDQKVDDFDSGGCPLSCERHHKLIVT